MALACVTYVGAITRSFGAMCVIIDVLFFSVTGESNKRFIEIDRSLSCCRTGRTMRR